MKMFKPKFFLLAVTVATFFAQISAASACSIFHYQPKMPQSLIKR